MTRPKAQKAAQASPEAPEDPLADLREPEDRYPDGVEPTQGPEPVHIEPLEDMDGAPFPENVQEAFRVRMAGMVESNALVSEDDQQAAVDRIILAWHDDTVGLGFLHKGGRCGCHYLARIVVRSLLPVALDPEDEAQAAEVV